MYDVTDLIPFLYLIFLQYFRHKTPKQRLLEKHQKSKVKKMPKKPAESKRGALLTPTTSGGNSHPWSRRYVEGGGRIPVVGSRRESQTGELLFCTSVLFHIATVYIRVGRYGIQRQSLCGRAYELLN